MVNTLRNLNVVIVTHLFASGPALDLEEFLKDKVHTLLFIGHPFPFRADRASIYRYYEDGNLVQEHRTFQYTFPDVLLYCKDALYTMWWVLRLKSKIHLYIGADNFDAFLGILLKKFGKVDDVVLYTVDYAPQRFSNTILNWFYHFFDRQCLSTCKVIWNVSPAMATAREYHKGLQRDRYAPQIVVPLGMWYKRFQRVPLKRRNRYQIVFMGHILKKQGLDVAIRGMRKIIDKIPQAKLIVIGTGDYEHTLKYLTRKLKLENNVQFTGYIHNHEEIEHILSQSVLAVAMYRSDSKDYTQFADPGKLKNYLGAGLPIIMTSIPPIAKSLAEKKCAVIAKYSISEFSNSVIGMLKNKELLEMYADNSRRYAKKFDWEVIFSGALSTSLGLH